MRQKSVKTYPQCTLSVSNSEPKPRLTFTVLAAFQVLFKFYLIQFSEPFKEVRKPGELAQRATQLALDPAATPAAFLPQNLHSPSRSCFTGG